MNDSAFVFVCLFVISDLAAQNNILKLAGGNVMLRLWGIFIAFDSLLFTCSSHPTGQIITKHMPEVQFVKNCSTCRTLRKLNFYGPGIIWEFLIRNHCLFFWFPGIKWGRREADHKSPSCAEVKNDWSFTSTHLQTFMACSGTIMHIVCIVEYNSH